ncbi:MAG: asparagine synthase (glutamine-hydrolyzing), partial [Candidatus Dadabacteria bacterium]
MCGVLGVYSPKKSVEKELFLHALNFLTPRGPDDQGIAVELNGSLLLGHRRLSIIDLSASGKQPMTSANKRWVIVYNGEIYNYKELRSFLRKNAGYPFKSTSDTEVILAAVQEWGVEKTLARLIGMWAFALWDREKKELWLVRDRVGIKPLYYGFLPEIGFFFSSELKIIKAFNNKPPVDQSSLELYRYFSYIPSPYSIYQNVYKLLPAHFLKINLNNLTFNTSLEQKQYWSLKSLKYEVKESSLSEEEALLKLEEILLDCIKLRLRADVRVGAFLSGGIDSSLVTALAQKVSSSPIKTFTIGFGVPDYDEAPWAKKVASYLGCEHKERYLEEKEVIKWVREMPLVYDEPFGDSSQIPTYLICRECSKELKVVLSGDGGDELFAGYTRYVLLNNLRKFPYFFRMLLAKGSY